MTNQTTTNKEPQYPLWYLATALILGVLATNFSAIFINMALPDLVNALGIETSSSHWVLSLFILTSTLSMLTVASLINRFSIRNTFCGVLLSFIIASIIAGYTSSYPLMLVCRAIQGLGMGILNIVALVTLYDAYPIEKRGKAGAVLGLGVALGPTLGPSLSGFLVEFWGWKSAFFAPLILALISLPMTWKVLPSKIISSDKKFDMGGFFWLSICLFACLGGLSYLQHNQWPLVSTLSYAVILAGLLAFLWQHQKKAENPLLLLSLFQYPAFNVAAIVSFVFGMGVWGSAFFLPLYLQEAIGMSVWETGMVMLPSGIALYLTLPFAGRISDAWPARIVVTLGLFSFAFCFCLMGFGVAGSSFVLLAILIAIGRGLGLSVMTPSLDATATRSLPKDMMSEGLSMIGFLRQLGGTLSPTFLILLLNWRTAANANFLSVEQAQQQGYGETLLGIGLIFFISLFASWRLPKTKFKQQV